MNHFQMVFIFHLIVRVADSIIYFFGLRAKQTHLMHIRQVNLPIILHSKLPCDVLMYVFAVWDECVLIKMQMQWRLLALKLVANRALDARTPNATNGRTSLYLSLFLALNSSSVSSPHARPVICYAYSPQGLSTIKQEVSPQLFVCFSSSLIDSLIHSVKEQFTQK